MQEASGRVSDVRRGDAPGSGVPTHPLPVPAHTRLALLGDRSDRTAALEELLRSTGREVARFHLEHVSGKRRPVPADVVFLSCDGDVTIFQAPNLRSPLEDAVVVCTVVSATTADPQLASAVTQRPLSAAQLLSSALPLSRVVGALQQFGPDHLRLLALQSLTTDVPVTGDDMEATDLVTALLDEMTGVEAIYAGPLRNSLAVEGLGQVLDEVEQDLGRPVGFRLDPLRGMVILDGRGG